MNLQSRLNYVLVPVLAIILALSFYTANPAFADLNVTTFTTVDNTYGTLTATSDCGAMGAGQGILWLHCNSIIYAVNDVTYVPVANFTIGAPTSSTSNYILASVLGQNMYISNNNADVRKFTLSGNTISLTGMYDPSGCTLEPSSMVYDELGFIWHACDAEDRIIRFNPSTMITQTFSQDLTDGAGLECDNPDLVAYATSDDIGVIHCALTNNYVTFEITSSTTINLLDDIADGSGEQSIMIHERYNRFFAGRSTGFVQYTYDSSGIITGPIQTLGASGGYDICIIEPYISSDVFASCAESSSGIQSVDIFFSNSTNVYQVSSSTITGFGTSASLGLALDIQDENFWTGGSTNTEQFAKLAGVNTLRQGTNPEPPSGGGGGGSNAVNGVCGNTDTNGDGRVNVLDCAGSNTAWTGITGGIPVTDVVGSVGDGIGLTDCGEDGDPETCGSGLFTFIIILILFEFAVLAGYLGLTAKVNADRETIDVLLLMLIVGFATVALGFYLNWIPDLVFYTIVALIAGFLTFGVIAKIRGK